MSYLPMCSGCTRNMPAGSDPGFSWRLPKPPKKGSPLRKTDSLVGSSKLLCAFFLRPQFQCGSRQSLLCEFWFGRVWTGVVCQSGRPDQLLSAPITTLRRGRERGEGREGCRCSPPLTGFCCKDNAFFPSSLSFPCQSTADPLFAPASPFST